jgi:tRNA threonylcarbamoyladenosine biosynthesis protein TsaE
MIQIPIQSLNSIDESARLLVEKFGKSKKIALSGEMGAGKTTLIQSICKVLGVEDIVNSPTFALINEYFTTSGDSIYHFDLYRINNTEEMFDFGYEDYFFSDDYCFIEWPEIAMELLPPDVLYLKIEVLEDGSRLVSSKP